MKKLVSRFVLFFVLISIGRCNAESLKHAIPMNRQFPMDEILLDKETGFNSKETDPLSFSQEEEMFEKERKNFISGNDCSKEISPDTFCVQDNRGYLNILNPFEDAKKVKNAVIHGVEKPAVQKWLDGDYAAGRLFGVRPLFESHGVTINSSMLYSPFVKTAGGSNEEASAKGYSMFNFGLTMDTEKADLWKGGTFFLLYQKKTGYGLSGGDGAMGDYMGFDGWDIKQVNQLSEYWYQQKFFQGKLRVKVGKQDSNTDFGYLNSGWDFMNSGFSVNPTTPLPTSPDTQFGFMAEINPKEWISIRDGIYSRYSSPFNITELEFKPIVKGLPGRYMAGIWENFDREGISAATGVNFDGTTFYKNYNSNYGCYVGFEQMIYKKKKDDKNNMEGLIAFGQFGIAPSNRNDMPGYFGVGLHYLGPFNKRNKDILGIAFSSGNFANRLSGVGDDYGKLIGRESVLEGFYRAQLTPWLYIQPDVQFIKNPGGMYKNSVAIGLRTVVTF